MKDFAYIPLSGSHRLKSYIFKVVCEKDTWPGKPNTRAIWRASVPALSGAHAWGNTEQEAFENLKDAPLRIGGTEATSDFDSAQN
jgi:hypothetical protein